MTISQFNILPQNKQMQLIWERGAFLSHDFSSTYKIALFSMEDFYVEVYYDQKQEGVKKIQAKEEIEAVSLME